jgi:hypothetical protein
MSTTKVSQTWRRDAMILALVFLALRVGVDLSGVSFENPAQRLLFYWPATLLIIFLGYQGLVGCADAGLSPVRRRSWGRAVAFGCAAGIALASVGWIKGLLFAGEVGGTPFAAPTLTTAQAAVYFTYGNYATEILVRAGLLSLALWATSTMAPPRRIRAAVTILTVAEVGLACYGLWAMTQGEAPFVDYATGAAYFGVLSVTLTMVMLREGLAATIIARVILGLIAEVLLPRL